MKILFSLICLFSLVSAQDFQYQATFIDTVSFERDSNATQYTAGDIMRGRVSATGGAFLVISAGSGNVRTGNIIGTGLFSDTANVASASFRVRYYKDTTDLYSADGFQLPADNAAFTSSYALSKYFIGEDSLIFLKYGTGGGSGYQTTGRKMPFVLDAGKTNIYAIILVDAAYTPKNRGKILLRTLIEKTY